MWLNFPIGVTPHCSGSAPFAADCLWSQIDALLLTALGEGLARPVAAAGGKEECGTQGALLLPSPHWKNLLERGSQGPTAGTTGAETQPTF